LTKRGRYDKIGEVCKEGYGNKEEGKGP